MEKSREAWHQIGIYDDMYDGLVFSIELCKDALDTEQVRKDAVPAQEPVCEECGMKYCECGERK